MKSNAKTYFQLSNNKNLGTLVSNTFRTLTGGILYYNYQNSLRSNEKNKLISYKNRNRLNLKYKSRLFFTFHV